MNFNTASASIFATACRKNGYNGDNVNVGFSLDSSGRVYCVHATGCHWAGFQAESEADALDQLKTARTQYWDIAATKAV